MYSTRFAIQYVIYPTWWKKLSSLIYFFYYVECIWIDLLEDNYFFPVFYYLVENNLNFLKYTYIQEQKIDLFL